MKTKNINQKLFELQNEIGTISKDAKNPFYNSKYFDINSLIKQLQPLLKKYKLLLQQPIEENMVVSKLICLEGGGASLSYLKLPEITDPQKIGSRIRQKVIQLQGLFLLKVLKKVIYSKLPLNPLSLSTTDGLCSLMI